MSLIQSNYSGFGSRTGAAWNRLHAAESRRAVLARETQPNTLAPRKRPLHTIIPAFMEKGDVQHRLRHHGRVESGPGARAVRVEHRRPRHDDPAGARSRPLHQGQLRRAATCRSRRSCPSAVAPNSTARGHELSVVAPRSGTFGYGQAVMSGAGGVHFGASEPRHDGAAIRKRRRCSRLWPVALAGARFQLRPVHSPSWGSMVRCCARSPQRQIAPR